MARIQAGKEEAAKKKADQDVTGKDAEATKKDDDKELRKLLTPRRKSTRRLLPRRPLLSVKPKRRLPLSARLLKRLKPRPRPRLRRRSAKTRRRPTPKRKPRLTLKLSRRLPMPRRPRRRPSRRLMPPLLPLLLRLSPSLLLSTPRRPRSTRMVTARTLPVCAAPSPMLSAWLARLLQSLPPVRTLPRPLVFPRLLARLAHPLRWSSCQASQHSQRSLQRHQARQRGSREEEEGHHRVPCLVATG